jgi:DNA-directed RNA polymerase subunit RPC12/RpoP
LKLACFCWKCGFVFLAEQRPKHALSACPNCSSCNLSVRPRNHCGAAFFDGLEAESKTQGVVEVM